MPLVGRWPSNRSRPAGAFCEHLRLHRLRLEAADRRRRDRLGRELLDATDHPGVHPLGERHRQAVAAGAAGAADAVHVVLGLHRQAVVDDVADRRHVDAARGDVGRDQDAQLARAQALQDAVAPPLRHPAVQRRDRVAELGEAVGEAVGVDLRAREDERLLDLALRQDVVEQRVLVREVVGPVQPLLDVGVGVGVRRDIDPLRLAQQVLREAGDVADEGGAVHHRLARGRQVIGDRRDVVDEAHVEHAVGLVEDEHLDAARARPCRSAGGRAGGPASRSGCRAGRAAPSAAPDRERRRRRSRRAGRARGGRRWPPPWRSAARARASASGRGRAGRRPCPCRAASMTSARAARTRCSAGRMNDAVLPLPVAAATIRSVPASAGGIAADWTSVGAA